MTPSEVITEVRRLTTDTRTPNRLDDSILLGFVNQTLKRMAILRPDLFTAVGDIVTTANAVLQTLPDGAIRLVELFQVKNGGAIHEVERDMLDRSSPTWTSDPAGVPVNYVRHPRNPYRYFLYPRPQAGIVLIGEYVQTPPTYTINQMVANLPDAYFPVVVDGTVALAQSIDNEHVLSGRAKLFQDNFVQSLNVGLQSRALTDNEAGAVPASRGSQ